MEKQAVSWYCGKVRAEASMVGNRISGYRYVTVNGCGWLNKPDALKCENCGRTKR